MLRLAWGGAWRRPLQSLFFIVGVSIGVAMIIAIDLANSSANRAFTISTDAVVGKATHQIVGGPSGVDESVYLKDPARIRLPQERPNRRGICQGEVA